MQKTSRFSRLLTLVTAVALAVCLPVSAYETKLLIRAAKLADDRVFREDHVVAIQNAERFIAYKGFCAQDCIRQAL